MEMSELSSANMNALAMMLMSGEVRVVDCTATLGPSTPLEHHASVVQPELEIHKISEYDADGPFFAWNWLKIGEHAGTHFDAPAAIASGQSGDTTDTVTAQDLAGPVCVIDVSDMCRADPAFRLTPDHIATWEHQNTPIPKGAWVVMHSGQTNTKRHPGPDGDAMTMLLERGIIGFGTDCISIDAANAASTDAPCPAQQILARAGCYGLASLNNLDQLPSTGAILIAPPLKFVGGTGSPVRALALVPGQ